MQCHLCSGSLLDYYPISKSKFRYYDCSTCKAVISYHNSTLRYYNFKIDDFELQFYVSINQFKLLKINNDFKNAFGSLRYKLILELDSLPNIKPFDSKDKLNMLLNFS